MARDARSIGAGGASSVAIVDQLASLVSCSRPGAPVQFFIDGILVCHQFGTSNSLRIWVAAELLFSAEPAEAVLLLCQALVLMICAWAAGFTVDSVSSRRTFAASAACCFLPCLFCLLRFRQGSLPRFCLLLFLLPAVAGVCFSRRGGTINRRRAFALALAATICMAVLAVRGHLWVLNWELIVPAWYLAILPVRPDRMALLRNEGIVS